MQLTFGMGLFWLLLASTVGETIVRVARARRRGRDAPAPDPALERRVTELEGVVAALTDARHVQDRDLAHLREQLEFTERLLAGRATDRTLP